LKGHNTFLEGHDFCFYYIFKTKFSGNKKIWGDTKEIWGALPPNAPRGYGHASVGQGGKQKVEGNGNLRKTKKIVTNYTCCCSTTIVTSNIMK